MKFLYEDNYLIVIEKPANIPVQSDKSLDADLVSMLRYHLRKTNPEDKEYYIGLVHRLDRPASGVMVFAKTKEVNALLSEQIRLGKMEKIYVANVCGTVLECGYLEDWLLQDTKNNRSVVVDKGTKGSKLAKLEYRLLETKQNDQTISKIRINLITGRHHQIRAQFANNNTPLVGDVKYNNDLIATKGFIKLNLHSSELAFVHPITKKYLRFVSTNNTF